MSEMRPSLGSHENDSNVVPLPHVAWTHRELSSGFQSVQHCVPDFSGGGVYGAYLSPWLQQYSWVHLPFSGLSDWFVILALWSYTGAGCFSLEP